MVCYWAAGWANLGMGESEAVPCWPSPSLHTGTAALLGQPSPSGIISLHSWKVNRRRWPALPKVITLCSVRNW